MFMRTCVPYVFGRVGPDRPRVAFKPMVGALNALLDSTADYNGPEDDEHVTEVGRNLQLTCVEALCLLERDFPETELSIFVHEIVHMSSFVYRWNSVRNYWCFTTERFVGWMKKFVQNRHLALENMIHLQILLHICSFSVFDITSYIFCIKILYNMYTYIKHIIYI